MKPFAVTDVEALDWNRFKLAALVTSDGEEEVFHSQSAWARAIEKLEGRVYAHAGGRYDWFFLPPVQSVVLTGSGILRARYGRAQLYDSFPLFPMSLAKIGKAVGLAKFENKSTRIDELTTAEVAEHCVNDCKVLAKALHGHQQWIAQFEHPSPKWPATAGGSAIYVAESLEAEGVGHLRAQLLSEEAWFDQATSVTGGRIELWQHGKIPGPVFTYDINSSYPKSWLEGPVPVGPWQHVTEEKPAQLGTYLVDVKQNRKLLPIVAPEHAWQHDGETWATSEEIEQVRAHGGSVTAKRGWVSETSQDFGARFVGELYPQKLKGSPFAKVVVNSLHGKFSQGLLQETHYKTQDGAYVTDKELMLPQWYQRPLIGGWVLARARIRLWRAMQRLKNEGWRIFYCDTDCVHTDCPPEKFPYSQSEECGEWKLEVTAKEAIYVAPKVYALVQDKETKLVCKGFPKQTLDAYKLFEAAKGRHIAVSQNAGLRGFRSLSAWGAEVATLSRTLTAQTGGKTRGRQRRTYRELDYPA